MVLKAAIPQVQKGYIGINALCLLSLALPVPLCDTVLLSGFVSSTSSPLYFASVLLLVIDTRNTFLLQNTQESVLLISVSS